MIIVKPEFSNSSGLMIVFEKLRFLDGLIAHFRLVLSLSIKARPGAQPFI